MPFSLNGIAVIKNHHHTDLRFLPVGHKANRGNEVILRQAQDDIAQDDIAQDDIAQDDIQRVTRNFLASLQ